MRAFVLWGLGVAPLCFARFARLGFARFACCLGLVGLAYGAPFISLDGQAKYSVMSSFRAFDYANANAKKGGVLKAHALGSFDSLNPFALQGQSAAGLELIYDTLMVQSMDEPYAQYALVASDVVVSPSYDSVTFTIDSRARFSDGVAISAQDVGFSFDMMLQNPLYKQYYADIAGYEILDSRKIRFKFATKDNRELPLILGQLSILPRHYYMQDGQNSYGKSPLQIPLGSGAYTLARYEVGKLVEYKRDENYWARDLPSRKGQFNFDIVRYEYYRDDTAAMQAFLGHKYDYRLESAAKVWARAYKQSKGPTFRKLEIPHSLPSGMQGFFMNLRKEPFDNPLVRRALLLAFNFEWSNENLFFSQYQRTTSFFNHSIFASTPTLSKGQQELLRACKVDSSSMDRLYKPYIVPSAPSLQAERENLKLARDLLEQAGYVVQNNQAYKNGIPLRFSLLLDNPAFERLAIRYARNLKLLGITMEIQKLDSSQYTNRVKSFDYDMIVGIIPQSLSPGNEQRYFFGSVSADTQGSRNYSGVKSKLVDCLIDRLINAPDRQQLVLATRTLDRVLLDMDIVVPHYFLPSFRLAIWDNIAMPKVQPLYDISPMLWWDTR